MTTRPDREARIFFPETRFEKLARRSGGITRQDALQRAAANIEAMAPGFAEWLDHKLGDISAAVARLDEAPQDPSRLDAACDRCRELRDVAATMGYELVTLICEYLCEIFEKMKAGGAYHKETIDCHVDALILSSTETYRNLRPNQVPELSRGLRRVIDRAGTASPALDMDVTAPDGKTGFRN